jgi:hypothetical protein
LSYSINKVYIIKELCVNKTKPEMHCDGKCYLKKQELQEAENEKLPVSQNKNEHSIAPHLISLINTDFRLNIFLKNSYITYQILFYSSSEDIPTPPPKGIIVVS